MKVSAITLLLLAAGLPLSEAKHPQRTTSMVEETWVSRKQVKIATSTIYL